MEQPKFLAKYNIKMSPTGWAHKKIGKEQFRRFLSFSWERKSPLKKAFMSQVIEHSRGVVNRRHVKIKMFLYKAPENSKKRNKKGGSSNYDFFIAFSYYSKSRGGCWRDIKFGLKPFEVIWLLRNGVR